MTVKEVKSLLQHDKPAKEKYCAYILPFDHFNNLTVYSRIWKNVPEDRYDFLCGRIALQTEGLQQRMTTTTSSDILASVKFDHHSSPWVTNTRSQDECTSRDFQAAVPNFNNNSCPRLSTNAIAEWFLHPRVQDLVDHQVALMEATEFSSFPNLAENKQFIRQYDSSLCRMLQGKVNESIDLSWSTGLRTRRLHKWVNYNNPFDANLMFGGLIPKRGTLPLQKQCKKPSKRNLLVGMKNISTLLEEHTSKYRLYNLALLQESEIPMIPTERTKKHGEHSKLHKPSLLQLPSFKYKDVDTDTFELARAFIDHRFEQIWHSEKFDESSVQVNLLTKKKSMDLWDLPRAELPSQAQLSPDSKILLWNVAQSDVSTYNSISMDGSESRGQSHKSHHRETATGLDVRAPVFQPTECKISPNSSQSVRRRLWEDNEKDDENSGCSELDNHMDNLHKDVRKRSLSDSQICSSESKRTEPGNPTVDSDKIPASLHFVQNVPPKTDLQAHQQNLHVKAGMRSQTPDSHVPKHAVVSVKDIEKRIQQQQRHSEYPLDVVCSPYHVSQHIQRSSMQHGQPIYQNRQQMQVQRQLQGNNITIPAQTAPQHSYAQSTVNSPTAFQPGSGQPITASMSPQTQLTYAQVANQQNQQEVQRSQAQQVHAQTSIPGQRRVPPEWVQHQHYLHQQQTQDTFQRQTQVHQTQQDHYNQRLLMEQHKGEDRSFQQAQAFHQEQIQRQAQTQSQQMWPSQPAPHLSASNVAHVNLDPTVFQLFQSARLQQQQIDNFTKGHYQQGFAHGQFRAPQQRMQTGMYPQRQTQQFHNNNSVHEHQIPWNNNNNSEMYSQQPPSCNPAQVTMHSSVDMGFKPEAARVFQLSQQQNQTLAMNHHAKEIPVYTEQIRQAVFLQQQKAQNMQSKAYSSTPHGQPVSSEETRSRQFDSQQFFRDAALASFATNSLNHANIR